MKAKILFSLFLLCASVTSWADSYDLTKLQPMYDDAVGYGYDIVDAPAAKGCNPFFFSVKVPDGNYRVTVVLGSRKDMDSLTSFDLANAEAFFVPAGTAIMLYSDTLHYAPCSAGDGVFQCVIVLPQGTNYPSEKENIQKTEEDKLLCMKNKWVITHPDSGEPFWPGLKGDIITV